MSPGRTYCPRAPSVRRAPGSVASGPTATIVSPSTATPPSSTPRGVTTRPFLITRSTLMADARKYCAEAGAIVKGCEPPPPTGTRAGYPRRAHAGLSGAGAGAAGVGRRGSASRRGGSRNGDGAHDARAGLGAAGDAASRAPASLLTTHARRDVGRHVAVRG